MKRLFFLLAATFAFNVCYSQYIAVHAHHVRTMKFQKNGDMELGGPYPCSFDMVFDFGDARVYIANRALTNDITIFKIFNAKKDEETSKGAKFSLFIRGPLDSSKNEHRIILTIPRNTSEGTPIGVSFQHENGDSEFFDTKLLQVSESSLL